MKDIFNPAKLYMYMCGSLLLGFKFILGINEIWAPLAMIGMFGFAWLLSILTDIKKELQKMNGEGK